jgi:hypothetical protein
VKRAIAAKSLDPLREVPELAGLLESIDSGDGELLVIDDRIISEKVRAICRESR